MSFILRIATTWEWPSLAITRAANMRLNRASSAVRVFESSDPTLTNFIPSRERPSWCSHSSIKKLETPEILLVPLYEIRIHAIHIRYRFTVAIVVLAGRIEHFAIRHDVPASTPQFIGLPGGNDFQVSQLAIRLLNQILQPAGQCLFTL
jgi:hypothetical protein